MVNFLLVVSNISLMVICVLLVCDLCALRAANKVLKKELEDL